MAEGADKTEEATPKKKDEARKEGQVARSIDVNGVVTLAIGLAVIVATGPSIVQACRGMLYQSLTAMSTPEVVNKDGLAGLLGSGGKAVGLSVLPVACACLVAGLGASVAQVGWKPSFKAIKPKPKKLDPLQGAKNIFGPRGLFEGAKSIAKVTVVGGVVAWVIWPKLPETAGLVGLAPELMGAALVDSIRELAMFAVLGYLVIAGADFAYQKHSHKKQLRMTKDEVRREHKDQDSSPEMKGAMRRRASEAARNRMMGEIPDADVVVTNPTHFAVALKYDGKTPAPRVVAKGQDLIALKIRAIATDHGVAVVEDKPLARSMYASVEVGREIPEELFQAVAHVLAYVYRQAGRRSIA